MSQFPVRLKVVRACLLLSALYGTQAVASVPPCTTGPRAQALPIDTVMSDMPESRVGNWCIRKLQEGRAAVGLPPAQNPADSPAAGRNPSAYKWGFLDKDGKLVIEPKFDMTYGFHQGLAPVLVDDLWGYIDRKGSWVIKPRFTNAHAFTTLGLAVVSEGGTFELIDRKGAVVGKPLGKNVKDAYLGDGAPALLYLVYRSKWFSVDGKTVYPPDGVSIQGPFGDKGLFMATDAATHRHGLIDSKGNWVVRADFTSIDEPVADAGLAVARGKRAPVLISTDGKIVTDRHVPRIRALGRHFWLLMGYDHTYKLIDQQGKVLHAFKEPPFDKLTAQGPFALVSLKDGYKVFVSGKDQPLAIPGGLRPESRMQHGVLLWRDGHAVVAGVLTSKGQWLAGQPWMRQINEVSPIGERLEFLDDHHIALNVLDVQNGKFLLSPNTAAQMESYDISPLASPSGDASAPVAIALLNACPCDESGAGSGLLLSDGTIIHNPDWASIKSLDTQDGGSAQIENGPAPNAKQRFAVKTAGGLGMIDASGKTLLRATQTHIGLFHGNFALVYGNGVSQVVDRDGKLYEAPDYFAIEVAGPGLLRYHETAAAESLWGLYDIVSHESVAKPAFLSISDFQSGYAIARNASGKAGVIDTQGHWIVPARYSSIRNLAPRLWLAQAAKDKSGSVESVVTLKGQAVVPPSEHLYSRVSKNGFLTVSASNPDSFPDRNSWLFSPDGVLMAGGDNHRFEQKGSWWVDLMNPVSGYVASDGKWAIRPSSVKAGLFHAPSRRALNVQGRSSVLIDDHGKVRKTLAQGGWSWPEGSAWLIRYDQRDPEKPKTIYADANGKTALAVAGISGPFQQGHALVETSDDMRYSWVDEHGRINPMRGYQSLGLPSDGLAFASVHGLYGYLDLKGRFAIAPVFEAASAFTDGRAVVSTRYSSMIIDKTGTPLARVTTQCGVRMLFNARNKRVWPVKPPQGCQ